MRRQEGPSPVTSSSWRMLCRSRPPDPKALKCGCGRWRSFGRYNIIPAKTKPSQTRSQPNLGQTLMPLPDLRRGASNASRWLQALVVPRRAVRWLRERRTDRVAQSAPASPLRHIESNHRDAAAQCRLDLELSPRRSLESRGDAGNDKFSREKSADPEGGVVRSTIVESIHEHFPVLGPEPVPDPIEILKRKRSVAPRV